MSLRFLIISFICLMTLPTFAEVNLNILIVNSSQRSAFHKAVREFKKKTGVSVKIKAAANETYKEQLPKMLESAPENSIFFGFAGARLQQFIDKGLVDDISDVWKSNNLGASFPSSSEAVSYKNKVYALPIQHYQWGIYYNKDVFAKNNLKEPKTWDDFLELCNNLKSKGIDPITLAAKDNWPLMGWIDYTMLRSVGIDKYRSVLQGKSSWSTLKPELAQVKMLFDKGYIRKGSENLSYGSEQAYLFQGKSAMMLMGNFWLSNRKDRKNIGFFRFPQMKDSKSYEIAPMDVLFLARSKGKNQDAKKFLAHFSQPSILFDLNQSISTISPNLKSPTSEDRFLRDGSKILTKADNLFFFFDREANTKFTKEAMMDLTNYMFDKSEINATISRLDRYFKVSSSAH